MYGVLLDWRVWLVIAYAGYGCSLIQLAVAGFHVSRDTEPNGIFHDRHRSRRLVIYGSAAIGIFASLVLVAIAVLSAGR